MTRTRTTITTSTLLCLPVLVAGCGGGATDRTAAPATGSPAASTAAAAYTPVIDPADFTATIDNPFLPMVPGTRRIYDGIATDGRERIVVEVLRETKTVMGVRCVVVRDTVTLDGEVIEDTYDWYAQHRDGSVWYFGEDTKEIENGKVVSTKGAWEAGVDGAQPGVVMPAEPKVGDRFRQEYAAGEAEDEFAVIDTAASATLTTGAMSGLVKTADTTRLDPDVVEHKYYARGVGFVLVEHVQGPPERIELVTVETF